ncbi:MAG: hypothetical protein FWH29_04685 [Methanobrevibacter sp.]|nr:hypothetical protein [Methanobrevibacter sp.]
MPVYTKKGDIIKGNIIRVEARKIAKIKVIVKSGRHKAQKTVLRDNAICVIDRELEFIK